MRSSKTRNSKGFTLVETMIALTIMCLSFAVVLMIQRNSINATSKAAHLTTISMLTKNLLIDTELKLKGKAFGEFKNDETGTFEEPFQEYEWKREVKEIEFPNLSMGAPAADGDKGGGSDDSSNNQDALTDKLAKLVSAHLTKSLRQVTVSVKWKNGAGSAAYSASYYWVDLAQPFKITQ
jgi:general secretion pathway protein I